MNFKQWSEVVESIETIQVDREKVRDIYKTPNNVDLIETVVFPYNIFKSNYSYVWVGLTLKDTPQNNELVNKYGGKLEQEPYGEVGYMFPCFDVLEQAYNFATEQKETVLKQFEKELI
jgi:hypothetical protein